MQNMVPDLQKYQAKVCLTASGTLIHNQKILLVKHKKLKMWLTPGGHLDPGELPHQAAEREFWEETGITVRAKQYGFMPPSEKVQFLPVPLSCNLHWVCRENYQRRKADSENYQPLPQWKKGCEQHLDFRFLVEAVDEVAYTQNEEETDGIGFFSEEEALQRAQSFDVKKEIQQAFNISQHSQLSIK